MSMFFSDLIFVTFLKILLFLKQKKCPLFSIFNQLVKSYFFSFLFFSHITVAHSYLRKPCPLHLHMCLKRKTKKNVKGKKKKIFPIDYNFSHFFFPVLSSASYLRTFFGNNVFFFEKDSNLGNWTIFRRTKERMEMRIKEKTILWGIIEGVCQFSFHANLRCFVSGTTMN